MEFWIRTATLQIGAKKYSLDDLAFDFEVPFEDSEELATATINAYNLSAATRNGIRKGDPVIINAGYEGDMGVIFVGQVSGLSHKRSTTDWCTKITATEALDEWLTAQINKTYQKGIKAKAMLQDLLNIFGIEIGTFDLAIDKEYPRGKVCKGKLKDVLTEIVVSDCKSRFLIRCGKIIINNPADGVNKGYLLSPSTGLLRSDEEREEIHIETGLDTKKSTDTKNEEAATKKRSSLLNYHLGPADLIKIQSSDLNGRFMIVRGTHRGSQSGDWKTEIEVKPA
jgi:hypothetical protein